MNIDTIGWFATVCFALSGVPLAWGAIKSGRSDVPWATVGLVLAGSSGMLLYEMLTTGKFPMLADFTLNAVCWATVAVVKLISEARSC